MGYKLKMMLACVLMLCTSQLSAQETNDDLDAYIKRLKHSSATGGSETAFLSVGSDYLYALEYLEAGNYGSAEYSFANILRAHPDHAYANYQYAISLIKQKNPEKAKLAQEYFQKAIEINPSLKTRYTKDVPAQAATDPEKPGTNDDLDAYIKRLKRSYATGGSETAFMSVGSDFLGAQGYFEAGNYSAAEYSFAAIVRSNQDHAFANYQFAISLIKQNNPEKAKLAREYLAHAFALNPSLKERYAQDVPAQNVADTAEPTTPVADKGADEKAAMPGKTAPEKAAPTAAGLENYIAQLKHSDATGGKETQMFAPGQEAIQGIRYYEKGEFSSAETRFSLSLAVDSENPYANYLMAVSLAAQGNDAAAKPFYQKAITGDKALEARYAGDVASGKAKWNKLQAAKEIKTTPAAKVTYGGTLVYGNYVCDQSVWNGPNISPAYRNEYKGYFALKKDGTYRWLDDGGTGRYSYNSKTGVITWLSGPMKNKGPKVSKYQKGTTVAQVSVEFNGFSWQCGCNK